jgi:uncharacterized membrane protein YesL
MSIVFEVFKVKGAESLSRRNTFSTLIFILVINLIIGAAKRAETTALILAVCVRCYSAVFLLPLLRSPNLKTGGYVSIALISAVAGFSSGNV